ncbi:hypothetical protein ACJX0J_009815 [Zea mays]
MLLLAVRAVGIWSGTLLVGAAFFMHFTFIVFRIWIQVMKKNAEAIWMRIIFSPLKIPFIFIAITGETLRQEERERAPVRIGLCIHWEQLLEKGVISILKGCRPSQSLDLGPVNFEMKFLQIWERWDLILLLDIAYKCRKTYHHHVVVCHHLQWLSGDSLSFLGASGDSLSVYNGGY